MTFDSSSIVIDVPNLAPERQLGHQTELQTTTDLLAPITSIQGDIRRGQKPFPHPFPARMPMAVAEAAIVAISNPGDLVLDPMIGSGVVPKAAITLGRNAIGVDIDPLAVFQSRALCSTISTERFNDLSCTVLAAAQELMTSAVPESCWAIQKTTMHRFRSTLNKFHSRLPEQNSAIAIEASFEQAVQKSLRDTASARKLRLQKAKKFPEVIVASGKMFLRNPDVVAEVLLRANGVCELCNKTAPFIRKADRTPYLEVHHKVLLSKGGEDTTENAIAICPNCHRREHFA